jgi:hypothetical protein
MDAQTADRTAAREGALTEQVDNGPATVALMTVFDQLAMLEDVVGALVPELERIMNPHDPSGDGDCAASEPAPATSQMTADLARIADRMDTLRGTLQSIRRRIEI